MAKPQAGEYWKTRDGRIVGPLCEVRRGGLLSAYTLECEVDGRRDAWTGAGAWCEGEKYPLDLVERVTGEVTLANPGPYASLKRALDAAFEQSARGKGAERHANHAQERFEDQDILSIPAGYGRTIAGPAFQVEKKMREANRMIARGEFDAAKREVLGACVYAAAAFLLIEKLEGTEA